MNNNRKLKIKKMMKKGGMIVLLEVAWFVIVMAVKSFNK